VPPGPDNLHRRLTASPDRLSDILCHREQRDVGQQLTLAYDRKQLILDRSALSEDLGGEYVHFYDFADGRLEVRWKGQVLPYRVFSKDQRVSHTAIVETRVFLGSTFFESSECHLTVKITRTAQVAV
jgi:hypothetical protein